MNIINYRQREGLITRFVTLGLISPLVIFGCISLYYFMPIEDYLRTIPITMDTNYELKAEYESPPGKCILDMQSSPDTGVLITVDPKDNTKQSNGTTNFTRTFESGKTVSLTAPATNAGKNFYKWTNDGSDYDINKSISVTMNANHTLVAVYAAPTPETNILSVRSSPDPDVLITLDPNDDTKQSNGTTNFTRTFESGKTASLTAPATNAGKNFYKWTNDGNDYDINKSISVTMNANHTLVAVYAAPTPETNILTVWSSPDKDVSMILNKNDNNRQCNGLTNFARTYISGTNVSLTAPYKYNGRSFSKWIKDGNDYAVSTFWGISLVDISFFDVHIRVGLIICLVIFLIVVFLINRFIINRPSSADFLVETEYEVKKVSWPPKNEYWGASTAVLISVVVIGFFIFIVDIVFHKIAQLFLYR